MKPKKVKSDNDSRKETEVCMYRNSERMREINMEGNKYAEKERKRK